MSTTVQSVVKVQPTGPVSTDRAFVNVEFATKDKPRLNMSLESEFAMNTDS